MNDVFISKERDRLRICNNENDDMSFRSKSVPERFRTANIQQPYVDEEFFSLRNKNKTE